MSVHLFGVQLVHFLSTEEDPAEMSTAVGFYELLKDESLAMLLRTLFFKKAKLFYASYTGNTDNSGKKDGPAYKFVEWLLGPRAMGEEFKDPADEV